MSPKLTKYGCHNSTKRMYVFGSSFTMRSSSRPSNESSRRGNATGEANEERLSRSHIAKTCASLPFTLFRVVRIVEEYRQLNTAVPELWKVKNRSITRVERGSRIVRRKKDERVEKSN
jgi:hypothetical protein